MVTGDKCRFKRERASTLCGRPAVSEVTVVTIGGKASVPACEWHLAKHDRSAAAKRVENK